MDNRTIDVVSEGRAELALALQLIWPSAPGGKATHFKEMRLKEKVRVYPGREPELGTCYHDLIEARDGTPTLILLWHDERDAQPLTLEGILQFDPDLKFTTLFVEKWLQKVDYGPEPDHDGDNGKGWRVFTEGWGHVAGYHYAICAIQPAWAMYGK